MVTRAFSEVPRGRRRRAEAPTRGVDASLPRLILSGLLIVGGMLGATAVVLAQPAAAAL